MAITEIHAIESTPNLALAYIRDDKKIPLSDDMQIPENYRHYAFEENGKKYIGLPVLSSYHNCNIDDPMSSYKKRADYGRGRLRKEAPRTKSGKEIFMWHLVQSFPEKISPMMANEIGQKLAAEVFGNFTVTVSTHTNTEHIHNHLMISAWDLDGRKWHDCHATKRQIRAVSDRLCSEYGLSVLEHTRDMQLVKYQDAQGKTKYYEPTDRKNALIRNREREGVPDAVGGYRHTEQYSEIKAKSVSNKDTIQKDIDALLPYVRSYEDLLSSLRDMGYEIRDKRKNGGYLAHVSFRAPGQDKATRDSSLGDGQFYCREQLEKLLDERQEKSNHREDMLAVAPPSIPYFEAYDYGTTDLAMVDDVVRAAKQENRVVMVRRSDMEKILLSDIRIKDEQVRGLIDATRLKGIIAKLEHEKHMPSDSEEKRLIVQIQSSFQCLRYIETHHIYSRQQLIDLYNFNKEKYDRNTELVEQASAMLAKFSEALGLPALASELERKIAQNNHDIVYVLEEYSHDKKQLEQYHDTMRRYKIESPDGLDALEKKYNDLNARCERSRRNLAAILDTLSDLEGCINTFARIDRENGRIGHDAGLEVSANDSPHPEPKMPHKRRWEPER